MQQVGFPCHKRTHHALPERVLDDPQLLPVEGVGVHSVEQTHTVKRGSRTESNVRPASCGRNAWLHGTGARHMGHGVMGMHHVLAMCGMSPLACVDHTPILNASCRYFQPSSRQQTRESASHVLSPVLTQLRSSSALEARQVGAVCWWSTKPDIACSTPRWRHRASIAVTI